MNIYRKWDYDKDEVITYEREGECNGCGECCNIVIYFGISEAYGGDARNGGENTDEEGVWAEVVDEGVRRFFKHVPIDTPERKKCPSLEEGLTCDMYFTKAPICSVWPVIPDQLDAFPQCSYKFKEIDKYTIEECPDTDE